jgi:hypothetical protein
MPQPLEDRCSTGSPIVRVVVNGVERAYPVDMIKAITHELVNDTLGGREVLVSWCGRCQSARAFDRMIAGRPLTFYIPGLLWNDNMVMEDEETGTLWSQMLGRGMRGSLEGEELTALPVVVTSWETWREEHPSSTVAVLERLDGEGIMHAQRYPSESGDAFLLGLRLRKSADAWTFDQIRARPCQNDMAGDVAVLVAFDAKNDTAQVFQRRLNGQVLTFAEVSEGLRDD